MQTGRCCVTFEAMVHNRTVMRAIALFLLAIPLVAQERSGGERLQPSVTLLFRSDVDAPGSDERRAMDVLFSTVEGAFRDQRRYVLDRAQLDIPVESIDHPAVVITVAARPDGSLGAALDIWDGSSYTTSRVFDLPVDQRRFSAANAVATAATEGVEALFDGFGRLRFTNEGAPVPFYVFADDLFLGASVDEIELPAGRYELEVRRRDDGFEHVVGRSSLEVRDGSYLDVRFSMAEAPPPVPGFLRLFDPEDRWKAIFDIRGTYMVPQAGFVSLGDSWTTGVFASGLFTDVLVRSLVMGFEAGHVYGTGRESATDVEVETTATPLMATLGLSIGPVAGVDFIVRGSAGMAFTGSTLTVGRGTPVSSSVTYDGYAPSFGGLMEFGVGAWRDLRISLHVSWFGVYEDETLFSWMGFGLGAGGRF
jgi:hypothetical protein